jgi:hypothetical protein
MSLSLVLEHGGLDHDIEILVAEGVTPTRRNHVSPVHANGRGRLLC